MICNPRCLLRSLCLLEAFPISRTIAPVGNDFRANAAENNPLCHFYRYFQENQKSKQLYPCFC